MSPVFTLSVPDPADKDVRTILVAEDEELIRLLATEYFRDCGYRVFEAGNVAEAKAVLSTNMSVDLVFSDVNMPGDEDGFALAKWIRQHHPDTKVLLTSGFPQTSEKTRDLDEPLMPKPYAYTSVLQRIQNLFLAG
jgi:CheY-like chemotaxis protein